MNSKTKLLITVLISAAVLAGAVFLYNHLSGTNAPEPEKAIEEESEDLQDAAYFTIKNDSLVDIELKDLNSKKPVIVNFWATWCPYCKVEMPYFEEMYKKYRDKINFIMLDVPDGERETIDGAKRFIEEEGYTFPVYYDAMLEGVQTYGVQSFPTTIAMNENGKITYASPGAVTEEKLQEIVEDLIKG